MRAIKTGYSDKRYELQNKLLLQNVPNTSVQGSVTSSQKNDNTLPFKVYGKNKAAQEFHDIVQQQKRLNNFNTLKDKFIKPSTAAHPAGSTIAQHQFSFRDIDTTPKEQREELRKAALAFKESQQSPRSKKQKENPYL